LNSCSSGRSRSAFVDALHRAGGRMLDLQRQRRDQGIGVAPQIAREAQEHGLVERGLGLAPLRLAADRDVAAVLQLLDHAAPDLSGHDVRAGLELPDQGLAGLARQRVVVDLDEVVAHAAPSWSRW
jgi:hypothetical protein